VTATNQGHSFGAPPPVPIAEPKLETMTELSRLRKNELESLSDRLGKIPKMPWSRVWGGLAGITLGSAIGGGIAGVQLLGDTDFDPTLYWVIVIATCVIGLVCAGAAFTTHDERSDSIVNIKDELDLILERYADDSVSE